MMNGDLLKTVKDVSSMIDGVVGDFGLESMDSKNINDEDFKQKLNKEIIRGLRNANILFEHIIRENDDYIKMFADKFKNASMQPANMISESTHLLDLENFKKYTEQEFNVVTHRLENMIIERYLRIAAQVYIENIRTIRDSFINKFDAATIAPPIDINSLIRYKGEMDIIRHRVKKMNFVIDQFKHQGSPIS